MTAFCYHSVNRQFTAIYLPQASHHNQAIYCKNQIEIVGNLPKTTKSLGKFQIHSDRVLGCHPKGRRFK
jgi:hypothetical protein